MSLTTRILLGFLTGLILGLFLGELTSYLKLIGDIYIGLMQMTVLPYIVFSLIGNIGRLSLAELKSLTRSALLTYFLMWGLAALTVLILSHSFPDLGRKQLFSTSLVEASPKLDWITLFVPANPFRALADNSVPAVVIFCIMLGLGILGLEGKKPLLDNISLIAKALHRVNGMIVRLTPVGVFAITANASGSMTLEEFEKLEGYYLAFTASILVMTLVILPLLVTGCTDLGYRQVLKVSRDGVLTAFVTGSVLSVIPLLINGVESLFSSHSKHDNQQRDFPEFILPLAYPFPNCGNIVALLFVSFAAWFIGQPMGYADTAYLLFLGFFLMFGKVFLAIPYLLDTFQLPHDMFLLFLTAGVLAGRLGDALSSMHYMVFTIVTTATMKGLLKIEWQKLCWTSGIMLLALLATGMIVKPLINSVVDRKPTENLVISRSGMIPTKFSEKILIRPEPNPTPLGIGQNYLQRIKQRGIIRVGYLNDYLPYSYFNSQGNLVGFDIDLTKKLADDLGVNIEFVPYEETTLIEQLNQDHFDIAISGLTVTLQRASNMLMTEPYKEVSLGLIVKDSQREKYASEDKINRIPDLRLGVIQGSYLEKIARHHFPHASIILFNSPRDFFGSDGQTADAFATHIESGISWTLIYPNYTMINPLNHRDSAPLAFGIGGFDIVLGQTLNTWISLQMANGTINGLSEHWMLGKNLDPKNPRWCLLRNVFHWLP